MNWGYVAAAAVFGLSLWGIDHLNGKLDLEKAAHRQTKTELAEALEKGMGWKAAYEEALVAADAHRTATRACLDRVAADAAAREERAEILQAAQPRPRTEQERQQVVNDETRQRAADRLNRDW
ncbi:MAG: hypothetical protein LBQ10_07250 [Desulfovibrio sp.]|jgi:hypothetical protein|nr:hypothetical protein [Desulfovibrio sp.]